MSTRLPRRSASDSELRLQEGSCGRDTATAWGHLQRACWDTSGAAGHCAHHQRTAAMYSAGQCAGRRGTALRALTLKAVIYQTAAPSNTTVLVGSAVVLEEVCS